jgi:hypothetical protein
MYRAGHKSRVNQLLWLALVEVYCLQAVEVRWKVLRQKIYVRTLEDLQRERFRKEMLGVSVISSNPTFYYWEMQLARRKMAIRGRIKQGKGPSPADLINKSSSLKCPVLPTISSCC